MRPAYDDRTRRRWAVLLAAAPVAVLALTGRWQTWAAPDTSSYVEAATSATPFAEMRMPFYGWIIAPLTGGGALPWLQTLVFAGAIVWLTSALRRAGASRAAAMAVALSLAWSNLLLIWGNAVLPEVPAHAALLGAFAATLELTAGASAVTRIPAAAVLVSVAWALRPSLLPFVVVVPTMAAALRPRAWPQAALLGAACVIPFLGVSTFRLQQHGDFNVVSFGGFQLMGMAALMLDRQAVARLPEALREDAGHIVERRQQLEAAGAVIAIPANSTGQHSFISASLFYFDILARSYDPVVWDAVLRLRRTGEPWPVFNARMQRLALATLTALPERYLAWIIGATCRLVGHAIVLNGALLLGVAAFAATRMARRSPLTMPQQDVRLLTALTLSYAIGSSVLCVLVTFPASRYIDSAALLLAAWPLYAAQPRPTPARLGAAATPAQASFDLSSTG